MFEHSSEMGKIAGGRNSWTKARNLFLHIQYFYWLLGLPSDMVASLGFVIALTWWLSKE
jgi:hypothetical protein